MISEVETEVSSDELADLRADLATDDVVTAWLMLALGKGREHAGNDGYDDSASQHYSWDDTVQNMPASGWGTS